MNKYIGKKIDQLTIVGICLHKNLKIGKFNKVHIIYLCICDCGGVKTITRDLIYAVITGKSKTFKNCGNCQFWLSKK